MMYYLRINCNIKVNNKNASLRKINIIYYYILFLRIKNNYLLINIIVFLNYYNKYLVKKLF